MINLRDAMLFGYHMPILAIHGAPLLSATCLVSKAEADNGTLAHSVLANAKDD
jgi:hypothetical protein